MLYARGVYNGLAKKEAPQMADGIDAEKHTKILQSICAVNSANIVCRIQRREIANILLSLRDCEDGSSVLTNASPAFRMEMQA
jgi:hypothetical protein